jgi:hypothetical protein
MRAECVDGFDFAIGQAAKWTWNASDFEQVK